MRPALSFVMLLALTGCERRVTALSLRDADMGRDGGRDAAYPVADPRFGEAGSEADFDAAVQAFSGRFAGLLEGDTPMAFTLALTPAGHGHGSFSVQCELQPGCDPFGVGSSLVESGTFSLVQVNARGEGEGELRWNSNLAPVQAEFWQLEVEADRVRFVVGQVGLPREAGEYARIELTRLGSAP